MKRITTRTPAQRIKRTIFAEYTFGALTRYGLDAHNKFKINWKKAHGVIKCRMIFYFILAHVWSKYHLREHTIDWRWVHRKWIIDYILWLMIRPSLVRHGAPAPASCVYLIHYNMSGYIHFVHLLARIWWVCSLSAKPKSAQVKLNRIVSLHDCCWVLSMAIHIHTTTDTLTPGQRDTARWRWHMNIIGMWSIFAHCFRRWLHLYTRPQTYFALRVVCVFVPFPIWSAWLLSQRYSVVCMFVGHCPYRRWHSRQHQASTSSGNNWENRKTFLATASNMVTNNWNNFHYP